MSLLNKLQRRRTARRKNAAAKALHENSAEDTSSSGFIALNLGNLKTKFENGQWLPQPGPRDESNENSFLKMQMTRLAEENNLLKLKNDVLLDMFTLEFLRWHGSFAATSEDNFFCCDLERKVDG